MLGVDGELVTDVVFVVGCALVVVDEVVAGVVTAVVLAVEVAELVVDFHVQLNQSPLLNWEYTRTLVSFDK